MSIKLEGDGAREFEAIGRNLKPAILRALERERPKTVRAMAGHLEERIVQDVFGAQRTPAGTPWKRLAPLTLKIRAKIGPGSTRAGVGPNNAMIQSFKVGKRGNLFQPRKDGFRYGSVLRKKGHLVAETFQRSFKMQRSQARFSIDRLLIRDFMLAVAGTPAPGAGKSLTHPARKIVAMPPKWRRELAEFVNNEAVIAVNQGIADVMQRQGIPHRGDFRSRLPRPGA